MGIFIRWQTNIPHFLCLELIRYGFVFGAKSNKESDFYLREDQHEERSLAQFFQHTANISTEDSIQSFVTAAFRTKDTAAIFEHMATIF